MGWKESYREYKTEQDKGSIFLFVISYCFLPESGVGVLALPKAIIKGSRF